MCLPGPRPLIPHLTGGAGGLRSLAGTRPGPWGSGLPEGRTRSFHPSPRHPVSSVHVAAENRLRGLSVQTEDFQVWPVSALGAQPAGWGAPAPSSRLPTGPGVAPAHQGSVCAAGSHLLAPGCCPVCLYSGLLPRSESWGASTPPTGAHAALPWERPRPGGPCAALTALCPPLPSPAQLCRRVSGGNRVDLVSVVGET